MPERAGAQPTGPDLLVDDVPTTSGWQGSRAQLNTTFESLRSSLRQESIATTMEALEEMDEAVEEFAVYARALVHPHARELDSLLARMDALRENFVNDLDLGTDVQLVTTMRLMEETLARMEELALISDLAAGRIMQQPLAGLPPDWNDSKFANEAMRLGLSLRNARELMDELKRSREELRRSARRGRLRPEDVVRFEEMTEMARALVLRQGEFPELMRPGFRNAALQIELVVENLGDYHSERNLPAFRRHLIELDRSFKRAEAFLELRDRLAREEQRDRADAR